MDLNINLIRSIVTVLAFIVFVLLVVRVWRRANREQYAQAAALPFADEQPNAPDVIPTEVGIHPLRNTVDPDFRRDDRTTPAALARKNVQ